MQIDFTKKKEKKCRHSRITFISLQCCTVWKLLKFSHTFWQKFRESNVFTKELISRNKFSLSSRENFLLFHKSITVVRRHFIPENFVKSTFSQTNNWIHEIFHKWKWIFFYKNASNNYVLVSRKKVCGLSLITTTSAVGMIHQIGKSKFIKLFKRNVQYNNSFYSNRRYCVSSGFFAYFTSYTLNKSNWP